MIAYLCLLMPALVLILLRDKLIQRKCIDWRKWIVEYLLDVTLINSVMLFILVAILKQNVDVFSKLNYYNEFALKYLVVSMCIAVAIPLGEWVIRNKKVQIQIGELPKLKDSYKDVLLMLFAVVCVLIHLVRLFEGNFWGDEGYTIRLSRQSFETLTNMTANDVHPPLYYYIVKVCCEIFGYTDWVYHLVSFIPYVIIIILSITAVRKWFGRITSCIFMTCVALLYTSIKYIVEVRMYEWAALFILVSFLALYKILTTNDVKYWVLFTVSGLCAAYTHYYALLSVAFLYIVIILDTIIRNRKNIKRCLLICVSTIVGYLPWLFIFLETFKRSSDNFWSTSYPGFLSSLVYIFDGKHGRTYLAIFAFCLVIYLVRKLDICKLKKKERKIDSVVVDLTRKEISGEIIWVLSSVFMIFGTILVGILVSIVFRPLYLIHYLYPAAISAWLVWGYCISHMKLKRVIAIALILELLAGGGQKYFETISTERANQNRLETTLEQTENFIDDDIIITDNNHIAWTIAQAYYPNAKTVFVSRTSMGYEYFLNLDKNNTYYFILLSPLDDEISNNMTSNGLSYTSLVENGYLGNFSVWIYEVKYTDENIAEVGY